MVLFEHITPNRWGWSKLGTRLTLALGTIILLTLSIALAAWIAMRHISDEVDQISRQQVPLINTSARLARLSGSITSTAPRLLSAQSRWEQEEIWEALQAQLAALQALPEEQPQPILPGQFIQKLHDLTPRIEQNLHQLNSHVSTLFELRRRIRELSSALRWSHAAFLDEISPILSDSRFNTDSLLEKRVNGPESAALMQQIRSELSNRERLQALNADTNLAVGLILRAASQSEAHQIETTLQYLGEIEDQLQQQLEGLQSVESTISIRQASSEILSYSHGNRSVPQLRLQELAILSTNQTLLDQNKQLLSVLEDLIQQQTQRSETLAAETSANAERAINRARALLILMAIVGFSLSAFVGWHYVGHLLLHRLNRLRLSMEAIANGDLETPVDTSGNDELSQMAQALLVFRNTAREVEDANAEAIIDNALVGLISTDESGCIEFVNPNARLLFQQSQQALEGLNIHCILAEEERCKTDLLALARSQKSIETLGLKADSGAFHLDLSARSFAQRQRTKYLFTLADATERHHAKELLEATIIDRTKDLRAEISERRKTEAELRATHQELIQAAKLAMLGQLSASIAHELNQPLSALRYNTHNLSRLLPLGREQDCQTLLDKNEQLADKMAKIINHLKVFARRSDSTITAVDLAAVVDSALELYTERLHRLGCEVQISGLDTLPHAAGDAIRLEQVLVNLIGNALDAMNDQPDAHLRIQGSASPDGLQLALNDNGCGMSADQLEQIFDPFFTTKEPGSGLGLGLSISRKILQELGGEISMQSRPGEGTHVQLTLAYYEA
ncbi:ATP-binding protein [Neptuniibacter halophilus]|uniref:ATP-binding protein n=1 Tax=Neptuniibacter halophilus TaxID=651666 RepID=UPI00257412C6|nr:ATP-binding protein [Neptuniibacter halophilus]